MFVSNETLSYIKDEPYGDMIIILGMFYSCSNFFLYGYPVVEHNVHKV